MAKCDTCVFKTMRNGACPIFNADMTGQNGCPYHSTELHICGICGNPMIEKAILEADLGINPQNDGKCIRLAFPQPTEERRKELAKGLSKKTEDAKVNIRGVRRDAIDFFKKAQKNSEITEDDLKSLEDEIQKLTDAKIKELEGIGAAKEKDIMSI